MPDTQFGLAWSQEVIRAFREMKTAHQFNWISFCCLLILVHIVHRLKMISTKNWIFSTSRSSRIAGDFMMRWTKLAHETWTFEWLKVERGVTLMFDVCSGTRLLVREWALLIMRFTCTRDSSLPMFNILMHNLVGREFNVLDTENETKRIDFRNTLGRPTRKFSTTAGEEKCFSLKIYME